MKKQGLELLWLMIQPAIKKWGVDALDFLQEKIKTEAVDPLCPKGWYWDTTTNSCQPDTR